MLSILMLVFSAFSLLGTGLVGAFVTGMWFDIWQGNRLGGASLPLMTIVLFVNLYKRKFTAVSAGFLLPCTIVVSVGLQMYREKQLLVSLHPYDILMQLFMTAVFYLLMKIVWRFLFTEKKLYV